MKNRYELKETTLLQLENEELRTRIKEINKKIQEYEKKMREMQEGQTRMGVLQESPPSVKENKNMH